MTGVITDCVCESFRKHLTTVLEASVYYGIGDNHSRSHWRSGTGFRMNPGASFYTGRLFLDASGVITAAL